MYTKHFIIQSGCGSIIRDVFEGEESPVVSTQDIEAVEQYWNETGGIGDYIVINYYVTED